MNNTLPDLQSQTNEVQVKQTIFRIGAGMLFVSAASDIIGAIFYGILNGWQSLGYENIVILIINIFVGVMLWQGSVQTALRWAFVLILYGIYQLVSGNSYAFILDIAFSGSLFLLLTGKPSKTRIITAIAVFLVVYLGLTCLGFTSYFILGVR